MPNELPGTKAATTTLDALVAEHRRFLAFLTGRVGDRALAEDILQSAFAKGLDQVNALRDEESAVAWFYRLLRNATIDSHRRRGAETRAMQRLAQEFPEEPSRAAPDDQSAVCQCVGEAAGGLAPEYATMVRRVDVDGISIAEVAAEQGITVNNARVRLHRARRALKRRVHEACGTCAEHGCVDCTCRPQGESSAV
jgi:RNA polymerase sigma-70 factor (ECF subfamily)